MDGYSMSNFRTILGQLSSPNELISVDDSDAFQIYMLKANFGNTLTVLASDFRDHAWKASFTLQDLSEMKERIGLAGDLPTFLEWLTQAFSSSLVRIQTQDLNPTLPANESASLIGQRAPREPLIRLKMSLLRGSEAMDATQELAFSLFQEYRRLNGATGDNPTHRGAPLVQSQPQANQVASGEETPLLPSGGGAEGGVAGHQDETSKGARAHGAVGEKGRQRAVAVRKRARTRGKGTTLGTAEEEEADGNEL